MVTEVFINHFVYYARNHGFILTDKGWKLSPAYDLNPSIDSDRLALNIDTDNNALDLNLAKSVGVYFRLNDKQMAKIIDEVLNVVSTWKEKAHKIGISKKEISLMAKAFNS